jgi:hypothetical protein
MRLLLLSVIQSRRWRGSSSRTSAQTARQGKVIGFEIWFEVLVVLSRHRFQLPQYTVSPRRDCRRKRTVDELADIASPHGEVVYTIDIRGGQDLLLLLGNR